MIEEQARFKGIDGKEYTSFRELEEAHDAYCRHQTIDDKFLTEPSSVHDDMPTPSPLVPIPIPEIHDNMPASFPVYDAEVGLVHILPGFNQNICIGFKVEVDESGKTREVPVYRTYSNPILKWSPDPKEIVDHSDKDGSNQRILTKDPVDDSRPSWSPDGIKIVYHSRRD